MKLDPFDIYTAPKGMRWPWSPLYTTRAVMESATPVAAGEGTVSMSVSYKVVGPTTKGRVGLRRWATHHAARLHRRREASRLDVV